MGEHYLDQLNSEQREAVLCQNGPMMIIAGAGSGKTRVLIYRITHLIDSDVDPFHILALTFTNKAAREMKNRISLLLGDSKAKNLWMGTFHSVFARILRMEADRLGFPPRFTIYDSQDSLSVITGIIKGMNLNKEIYKPKIVQGRISHFKNNLITTKVYNSNYELQENDAAAKRPKLGDIYQKYVDKCFQSGAMDFDDLLLRTNELLARFPDVLAKYQELFRYILVDEYQDTNNSQYLIIKALASRYENLCVVGDDAQSIYGFRGANIQNILSFQKDYPNAKVFRLEQNYRSTKIIVRAANSVIKNNKFQLKKEVWTDNDTGERIKIFRSLSDSDESGFIGKTIFDEKMEHQRNHSDFAILYRTNAQSRAIEDELRKKNLPYRVFGGLSFYQRKEVKDLVAYLRLIVNPLDEEALQRVINYPTRGIGNTSLNKIIVAANEHQISLFACMERIEELNLTINSGTRNRISDFVALIKTASIQLQSTNAFEAADFISKKSGLFNYLYQDKTLEGISRYENIQELLNGIKVYVEEQKQLVDGDSSLSGFLQNIALTTTMDTDHDKNQDVISLMTIHMAKGLEFPIVFIIGLEENLFPSLLSMNSREYLEEERRLFYVALTRAQSKVYLTYALTRYRWGKLIDNEPSRFLEEIDEEYVDYPEMTKTFLHSSNVLNASIFDGDQNKQPKQKIPILKKSKNFSKLPSISPTNEHIIQLNIGDHVQHNRFGTGQVKEINDEGSNSNVIVDFKNHGEKKLILKFARLKRLK